MNPLNSFGSWRVSQLTKGQSCAVVLAWLCGVVIALQSTVLSFAERVDRCRLGTYIYDSGIACSFTVKAGESIRVRGKYRDTSPDYAHVSISPLTGPFRFNQYQERTISHRVLAHQSGARVQVLYSIFGYAAEDFLDLETWSERSDLGVQPPYIDATNADLVFGFNVTTNEPFVPVGYIPVEVWAGKNGTRLQLLESRNLDPCVNKGGCSHWYRTPTQNRRPIDRGLNQLFTVIDPADGHAEMSNENNVSYRDIGPFFVESIPSIMANIGSGWKVAGAMLDVWFNSGRSIKDLRVRGIDWGLPVVQVASTAWVVDYRHAADNRVKQKFDRLVSPGYIDTSATREHLRRRMIAKFSANRGAKTLPISEEWRTGARVQAYHDQHIRHIQVQDGGIAEASVPLDSITAAFGGFSLYLVPLGNATVINSTTIKINIRQVAVHVIDSFDFHGVQPLGCWAKPNIVSRFGGGSQQCVSNAAFKHYRPQMARGFDYTAFTGPTTVTLAQPIVYEVKR